MEVWKCYCVEPQSHEDSCKSCLKGLPENDEDWSEKDFKVYDRRWDLQVNKLIASLDQHSEVELSSYNNGSLQVDKVHIRRRKGEPWRGLVDNSMLCSPWFEQSPLKKGLVEILKYTHVPSKRLARLWARAYDVRSKCSREWWGKALEGPERMYLLEDV